MGKIDYRQHLRTVVAASAAPYGYTLTLWTAGAVTSHAEGGIPSTVDALLLLVGAVVGFLLVGAVAYGGVNVLLAPTTGGTVRVWGGMHLPSVGVSILACSLLAHFVHGHVVWPLVGLTATAVYLLVIALQFAFATLHRGEGQEGR